MKRVVEISEDVPSLFFFFGKTKIRKVLLKGDGLDSSYQGDWKINFLVDLDRGIIYEKGKTMFLLTKEGEFEEVRITKFSVEWTPFNTYIRVVHSVGESNIGDIYDRKVLT